MNRTLAPLHLLVLLLVLLLPGARADAAPIQRDFEADLTLYSGILPPIFFFGSGTATVDVTGNQVNALSLPAGVFSTQVTTGTAGLEIRVDAANGPGLFSANGTGVWSGSMPILGNLRICLGATCSASPFADVSLPLDVVGQGGVTTTSTPSGAVFVVSGSPWQTSTTTLSGPGFISIFSGFQSGPLGLTGSTALPGGLMVFVSPAFVSIPGLGGIPFVAELGVTFVPEPGAFALVGAGVLGLVALARRSS